jgi:thiol-disulfide isomerase/thioredoxin
MEFVNKHLSKKSNKQLKTIFFLGCLTLFFTMVLIHGLYIRFILNGCIVFVLTYLLLIINPYKWWGYLMIYAYLIISTPVILYMFFSGERIVGILVFTSYFLFALLATLYYKYRKAAFIYIYLCLFGIGIYHHDSILINYSEQFDELIVNNSLPVLNIVDDKNNYRTLRKDNSIQVINFWTNSCGACIKQFPNYEALYQKYRNNKFIEVISVNATYKNDRKALSKKKLKGFNFSNFFLDAKEMKNFKINAYPTYLIVDKKGIIKFQGYLNPNKMNKIIEEIINDENL